MSEAQSPFNLAQRIELRGAAEHSWWVVVSNSIDLLDVVGDFCFELETLTKSPTRSVAQFRLSVEELRTALSEPCNDIVVIIIGEWTSDEWEAFDINRSTFERPGAIILWMLMDQLNFLPEKAPNIRSYIGGSIFMLGADGGDMTAAERDERLVDLQTKFKMTNQQFLAEVSAGRIGTDPQFLQWLVLLGRGDLIR